MLGIRDFLRLVRTESKYVSDPLMILGIFWSALSIFSFIQNFAEFDLGKYFGVLVLEFHKLGHWISSIVFFPFNITIPQVYSDALAVWLILAGTTARAQQIKFKKNALEVVKLLNSPDSLTREEWEEEFVSETFQHAHMRRQSILCVPVNLIVWPLVISAEIFGLNSSSQILNLKTIYIGIFSEGFNPELTQFFSSGARVIFMIQWFYILVSLVIFFAMNALDAYMNKPNIL